MLLLGSQAQRVNVIFNFLVLLRFLTSLNEVRFYSIGEVRSRLNSVDKQTWRIIALFLRCEAVDMDAPRTVSCYSIGHLPRL